MEDLANNEHVHNLGMYQIKHIINNNAAQCALAKADKI